MYTPAEDFRGSATGAAGTRYFEPDGVCFFRAFGRPGIPRPNVLQKPFSRFREITLKRTAPNLFTLLERGISKCLRSNLLHLRWVPVR